MHANEQKSNGSTTEKATQILLNETMTLNSLLTDFEPYISYIIRASNPLIF